MADLHNAEQQEPVAWQYKTVEAGEFVSEHRPVDVGVWQEIEWSKPLYAQPPQRQPLTDAEIEATFLTCNGKWDGDQWVIEDADFHPFARAIEQAHGIGEKP